MCRVVGMEAKSVAKGEALHVVAVSGASKQDLGWARFERRDPSLVQSRGGLLRIAAVKIGRTLSRVMARR
jgi:hypothetical protein